MRELPAPESIAALRRLMNLIADGRYAAAVAMCAPSRLSAADIEAVIKGFKLSLLTVPDDFLGAADCVAIAGTSSWWVGLSLWSREEGGRSDLTLEVELTERDAGPSIVLDGLHVL